MGTNSALRGASMAATAPANTVPQFLLYHVGGFPPGVNEMMVRLFRQHMPNHAHIWTSLGVAALGDPTMRVEIRVTAIVP
ncbi:hypothetical protein F0U60_34965 [Archangium minus]|uniref:Uncharacterized protein n=1 Tax=Archangium minus TaxID=83450 RepID=A0ABY9X014_9BACT|nr:hypothetical protein F0U60_34965 [Archangium minus]